MDYWAFGILQHSEIIELAEAKIQNQALWLGAVIPAFARLLTLLARFLLPLNHLPNKYKALLQAVFHLLLSAMQVS